MSALVSGSFVAVDLSVGEFAVGGLGLVWAAGLGASLGAVHGLAWDAVTGLSGRLRAGWLVWLALACGGALLLADRLGAGAKLDGPDHELAVIAIALCALAGLGLGGAAAFVQRDLSLRALAESTRVRPGAGRLALGVVAVVAVATTAAMDRSHFVGLYPQAHLALRLAALWITMLAAVFVWPLATTVAARARILVGVALAALGAWPLLAIDDDDRDLLHAMSQAPFGSVVLDAWRALLDFDRDGYAARLGAGDCDDFDAEIGPGAREIPANGVDDNCVLGDASARDVDVSDVEVPGTRAPTSVVLVTIDTLRADHTGAYGHDRGSTPALDAFARRALVFERAYSAGGLTALALPAMHRGVYARRLELSAFGVTTMGRFLGPDPGPELAAGEEWRWFYGLPARDPHRPLAWWLARRGMSTAAVVDDGGSGLLGAHTGIAEGFGTYVDLSDPEAAGDDQRVADRAIAELSELPTNETFFLWVHFYGPHSPHRWHDEAPRWGEDVAAMYDHEVAFMDLQLGRLLAAIEEREQEQAITTIVTSDHGEIFNDLVRFHGTHLRDDILRVPLLLRAPGVAPGRVETLVSGVDVFPTVLAVTETPGPRGLDGVDVRALVSEPRSRTLLADLWRFQDPSGPVVDVAAAFDGRYRLTMNRRAHTFALEEQTSDRVPDPTRRVDASHLERTLLGYLEESGSDLRLTDRP